MSKLQRPKASPSRGTAIVVYLRPETRDKFLALRERWSTSEKRCTYGDVIARLLERKPRP